MVLHSSINYFRKKGEELIYGNEEAEDEKTQC